MRYLALSLLLLTACSHNKFDDVHPGSEGLNTVDVKNPDDTEATREAMRQASAYCKDQDKKPEVVKETKDYYGDVTEQTYKRMRRAGKAAETISGGVIKKGDQAASDYAGAGYEVKMEFRCANM